MSFFDELTEKARSVAVSAEEKAREVADSAKISTAILQERRKLDRYYRAIGQWMIAEGPEAIPEAIAETVAAAKASLENIRQLKDRREAAEKKEAEEAVEIGSVCPVCGKVSTSRFCPDCGTPLGGVEDPSEK